MTNVIEIKQLNKRYAKGPQALKSVDLSIEKGEIFGLLGPNGAGKTTLINIIAGLAKKDSGEALVMGRDVVKDYRFTRRKIGVVQQEINADAFASLKDTVKFQGGFYGLRGLDKKAGEILRSLELWDDRNKNGRQLSGGMKRRAMIAKALVHDPEILFLDEPTAGVDVELRENLWKMIRKLQSEGKTIILTTHYIEEAEELADRIGMIFNGEIVLVEKKADLMKRFNKQHLKLCLDKPLSELPEIFRRLDAKMSKRQIEVTFEPGGEEGVTMHALFSALNQKGVIVKSLEADRMDLKDIFLHIMHQTNGKNKK